MTEPFLRNIWYFALPSTALRRGRMTARRLLGEPLLFGRAADGTPFALRDICPHRGIPLSYGRFDGAEIECCYHGWRFDTGGRCTAIPSLVEGQRLDLSRIRVPSLPCREAQGCIWIYWGDGDAPTGDIVTLPDVPEGRAAGIAETMTFPCAIDHAVVGLMDPAHGPFVHRSWWWRTRSSIHEKAKAFAPSPLGFQMVRHRPSSNSRAYRLLGGVPETEITFRLPGVRIEHIRAGRHVVTGLTAVTPIDAGTTQVAHLIWWTTPWLGPLRPVARLFVRAFLKQDRDIVAMQQEGLRDDPPLMLINDADMQAKWYYQLKAEYAKAQSGGRPFANPVTERVLRWRS
ncbi:MAG TPA: aromatic ring-hydroxylating dioxygenase subunit alpha [Alphaproteobacteria bacterium]